MHLHFTDQFGRIIRLDSPPKRIVSLVPSQTELLFYLGLEKEVVGITKFCIHPEEQFRVKTRIGGTKKIHFDRIQALQPDLIIGNKEENDKEQIEQLAEKYPVWLSDIKNLEDALDMIDNIGAITHKKEQAEQLIYKIRNGFAKIPTSTQKPKIAYFIWKDPMMVAASDTFINEMLQKAGFENAFAHLQRYPEINEEQLNAAKPDALFLSSEPFPFKEKHFEQFQYICPKAVIKIVDGELFSWYGNRLLFSADYFINLKKEFN